MKPKDRNKERLIEYLANPENEWPSKEKLSQEVLGKKYNYINRTWSPGEFQELIAEPALRLRRGRYAKDLAEVDRTLLRKAKEGNVQAAKLIYQRFEGWKEGQTIEAVLPEDKETSREIAAKITNSPRACELASELLTEVAGS